MKENIYDDSVYIEKIKLADALILAVLKLVYIPIFTILLFSFIAPPNISKLKEGVAIIMFAFLVFGVIKTFKNYKSYRKKYPRYS
jgi:hypothetical protein